MKSLNFDGLYEVCDFKLNVRFNFIDSMQWIARDEIAFFFLHMATSLIYNLKKNANRKQWQKR